MADYETTTQAILDTIEVITKAIATHGNVSTQEKAARTVRDLAETYAWLVAPAQPHGGTSTSHSG